MLFSKVIAPAFILLGAASAAPGGLAPENASKRDQPSLDEAFNMYNEAVNVFMKVSSAADCDWPVSAHFLHHPPPALLLPESLAWIFPWTSLALLLQPLAPLRHARAACGKGSDCSAH
ncbi:calcium-binding protein [Histoplasma capsulatum]|uniref:Calcium-binding protein n=1 Tax=Ajellomyces capsulatus TaxID=5037 RepID=A0A8A1MAF7_AJECA|nr:predicted protein [Histoplasma mississippiense (nom. inval.)]EDN08397.1 predicted protein [Histoplasma mississippiense (nom. inval.)]QSS62961.1 calcium-binding protein [Histoplasma capsulatum]